MPAERTSAERAEPGRRTLSTAQLLKLVPGLKIAQHMQRRLLERAARSSCTR
jgi:hypothetical protein